MAKIKKVKWFTPERVALINKDNLKLYDKYYNSCTIKNPDMIDTTFKTYKANFIQFLCWLAVHYGDLGLYSEEFLKNAVDIMEEYIAFAQTTLLNGKKTINNKIAAVSTFYLWSLKRGLIQAHPFDKKLERMKYASEDKRINSYFLTHEQVECIRTELETNTKKYNIQDRILFEIAMDSANRLGALERLTLSALDIDNMIFTDIREKRAYKVEVVFEDRAKDLILEWLEMRKDNYDKLEVDSLLIAYYDKAYRPMKRGVIHYKMRRFGEIVGIPDFHAHCSRKTSLNLVYEDTGDLLLASELANHKDTGTTVASYIKRKSKTELREKINALKEKKAAEESTE